MHHFWWPSLTFTGLLDYCDSVLFGLPANLIKRLQSVQNAAARLTFRIRRSEHITAALISLHWLCVPERMFFKLAVLTYRSIHGTSPSYPQSCFTRVADMTSRRRLRSSASHRLEVPPVRLRLSTVGERAFPVADANMWNDLLFQITSAQSLVVFRRHLKTFLFSRSYPDNDILLILLTDLLLFSGIPCKPCNNWHFWTFQSTDQSHGTVCHRH